MRLRIALLMLVLVMPTAARAHDDGGKTYCGGTAPTVMQCTTGVHQHTLPQTHYLYYYFGGTLTGTFQSKLAWPADGPLAGMFGSVITCSFSGGTPTACTSTTQPAPPGVATRQLCTVTGSGSLSWLCGVAHDTLPPSTSSSVCTAPYVPGTLNSCTFTYSARPLGALAAFPGADPSKITVEIRDASNNLVTSCTPIAGGVCGIVDDPGTALGGTMTCVVRDNGSGARGGDFGCSAGL